jgi:hypothetical protein
MDLGPGADMEISSCRARAVLRASFIPCTHGSMKQPSSKTSWRWRWIWFLALFAAGSSIGWKDRYYWSLSRHYRKNSHFSLARAYARDFERQHDRLPTIAELIPYAEKRFHEDLQRMEFSPRGDTFFWKEEERP